MPSNKTLGSIPGHDKQSLSKFHFHWTHPRKQKLKKNKPSKKQRLRKKKKQNSSTSALCPPKPFLVRRASIVSEIVYCPVMAHEKTNNKNCFVHLAKNKIVIATPSFTAYFAAIQCIWRTKYYWLVSESDSITEHSWRLGSLLYSKKTSAADNCILWSSLLELAAKTKLFNLSLGQHISKSLSRQTFALPGLNLNCRAKNQLKILQYLPHWALLGQQNRSLYWHDIINNSITEHSSNIFQAWPIEELEDLLKLLGHRIEAIIYDPISTEICHDNSTANTDEEKSVLFETFFSSVFSKSNDHEDECTDEST